MAGVGGLPEFLAPRVDLPIAREGNLNAAFELSIAVGLTFLVPGLEVTSSDAISPKHFGPSIERL